MKYKFRNGGIYLVDLKNKISPEFKYKHFCILIKTGMNDLFIAFPLTTSEKRGKEKYTIECPNNEKAFILFQQVCVISKRRIKDEKCDENGDLVCLTEEQVEDVMKEYNKYLNDMLINAKRSIRAYEKNKNDSKLKMEFVCPDEITIYQGERIDYKKIPSKTNGGSIQINRAISTKEIGDKEIELTFTDVYFNKISKRIIVHVINRDRY